MGADPERLQRGERYGGLGRSNLTIPEWINSIHTLFPQQVIERLESDAVLRYGIEDDDESRRAGTCAALLKGCYAPFCTPNIR